MDNLNELADRVAALAGPDRGLDAEVYALLNPGDSWVIGHEPGRFPQKPIYGSLIDAVNSFADKREAGDFINAPAYTASLEAALTLVPQGWWWTVGDCSVSADASMGPDVAHCDKAMLVRFDEGLHHDLAHPSTPAIALASLALRARAALGDGHE